jgi:hypothetical protein
LAAAAILRGKRVGRKQNLSRSGGGAATQAWVLKCEVDPAQIGQPGILAAMNPI